uniref:Uncharacterized protein n=1 Tax=Anopheles dirus TaxID=7168 RepID=A0A182NM72_9DIPT
MVIAGEDRNGNTIYVGRALHKGDILPANVIPARKTSYVVYDGREIAKKDFEVLVSGEYEWKYNCNGKVPNTALKVGQTIDDETLYMGRASYNGWMIPGKVHPSHGCCYLPHKGKEVNSTHYEVLCVSPNKCSQDEQKTAASTDMVIAGKDRNGNTIYVGRAPHEGDMLPANVIPARKISYVCYDGQEIAKTDFKVLVSGEYEWKYNCNGKVPSTALKVGQTFEGESLYMGRAIYNGSMIPGKVHPSHGCCYLPDKGKEVSAIKYEVLCIISYYSV